MVLQNDNERQSQMEYDYQESHISKSSGETETKQWNKNHQCEKSNKYVFSCQNKT